MAKNPKWAVNSQKLQRDSIEKKAKNKAKTKKEKPWYLIYVDKYFDHDRDHVIQLATKADAVKKAIEWDDLSPGQALDLKNGIEIMAYDGGMKLTQVRPKQGRFGNWTPEKGWENEQQ